MDNKTITRSFLAKAIHNRVGFSIDESSELLDKILEQIKRSVKESKSMKIPSFGTFHLKQKKERVGRNPKTMVEAVIKARKVVNFTPSRLLKKQVNGE